MHPLEKKFFIQVEDEKNIKEWQFLSALTNDYFLVQLYERAEPTDAQIIVPINSMLHRFSCLSSSRHYSTGWIFYDSLDKMKANRKQWV